MDSNNTEIESRRSRLSPEVAKTEHMEYDRSQCNVYIILYDSYIERSV